MVSKTVAVLKRKWLAKEKKICVNRITYLFIISYELATNPTI
jgi:hypothetical protein